MERNVIGSLPSELLDRFAPTMAEVEDCFWTLLRKFQYVREMVPL